MDGDYIGVNNERRVMPERLGVTEGLTKCPMQ